MGIDRKRLPLRLPASPAQRPSSVWLKIICHMTTWESVLDIIRCPGHVHSPIVSRVSLMAASLTRARKDTMTPVRPSCVLGTPLSCVFSEGA